MPVINAFHWVTVPKKRVCMPVHNHDIAVEGPRFRGYREGVMRPDPVLTLVDIARDIKPRTNHRDHQDREDKDNYLDRFRHVQAPFARKKLKRDMVKCKGIQYFQVLLKYNTYCFSTIRLPIEYPAPKEQIMPLSPVFRSPRCSWNATTEPAPAVLP